MAARMSQMKYQAPQACRSMCSMDLLITLMRTGNQSGKPDPAFADIPSGVNVLEENVTEDPEFCVIS